MGLNKKMSSEKIFVWKQIVKYHYYWSLVKMTDIKIFVVHHKPSIVVNNSLFVDIHGGANESTIVLPMRGDNTGDNISNKNSTFNEMTVQYWAWKNISADYYGLCHYRRYLSFAEKMYPQNERNHVFTSIMDCLELRKYGLLNKKKMEVIIKQYDAIIPVPCDVRKVLTPYGIQDTLYNHWLAFSDTMLDKETVDLLIKLIQKLRPEYYDTAIKYFAGHIHHGNNCYILNQKLFYEMCEFQFPILFELEQHLDLNSLEGNKKRAPGYCGEILNGIFIHHLKRNGSLRIKESQLIHFDKTTPPRNKLHGLLSTMVARTGASARSVVDICLPKGSKRREYIKKIYYTVINNH